MDLSKCILGDPVHDEEHIKLFSMMDTVIEAVRQGRLDETMIQMVLSRLRDHFVHECEFMRQMHYPKIKEHVRDHESIITLVEKIIRQVRVGSSLAYSTIIIENMFMDHIQHYDAALYQYLHDVVEKVPKTT